jgi:hypothetical protein
MPAAGIRTYLPEDVARQVSRIALAQGRSESSFIAETVCLRLAADAPEANSAAAQTTKRQLNRLETRVDKIQRDQAYLREALLVLVRVWLEHNPPLDEAIADSLAASAANRFERFLDLVEHGVAHAQKGNGRSQAHNEGEASP